MSMPAWSVKRNLSVRRTRKHAHAGKIDSSLSWRLVSSQETHGWKTEAYISSMLWGGSKINIINRGIDIMCLHRSGSVRKKKCCGTHSGRAERNRLTEKEMVYFYAEIFIWHTFPAPTVIDLRFILSQSSQISNKLLTVLTAWNVSSRRWRHSYKPMTAAPKPGFCTLNRKEDPSFISTQWDVKRPFF